jgi:hypothetical protein
VGDVEALSALLREAFQFPENLKRIGQTARDHMASWSPTQNLEGLVTALKLAIGVEPREKGRS